MSHEVNNAITHLSREVLFRHSNEDCNYTYFFLGIDTNTKGFTKIHFGYN